MAAAADEAGAADEAAAAGGADSKRSNPKHPAPLALDREGRLRSRRRKSPLTHDGPLASELVRRHPPQPVSPDSLFALRDGSSLTLTLFDSTAIVGRKLRPHSSDFDSTAALAVLCVLPTAKSDPRIGDTLVVPISEVAIATVPGRRTAGRRAAAAGAKPDIVVLEVVGAVVLAAVVIVGLFGLILTSSGFSF